MRRLAVADVHGCASKLDVVLTLANYDSATDRLFLLGDYIDRGPQPAKTVEIVRALVRTGAVALMGNHEAMALEAAAGSPFALARWSSQGGIATFMDYGMRLPLDVIHWFCALPLYVEEPDCILVHAGLRPGTPLAEQDADDLLWIRDAFYRDYRGKHVIFGHTPTIRLHGKHDIWCGPCMTGIDTGAVSGGVLTLLDLDSGRTWAA